MSKLDLTAAVAARLPAVCPVAPEGAQAYADTITGYVLWGVISLFVLGLVVSVGSIVAGRIFAMQHASKAGVVGVAVIFMAGLAYLILPPMLNAFLGEGCV
jgi:hypothetical protein